MFSSTFLKADRHHLHKSARLPPSVIYVGPRPRCVEREQTLLSILGKGDVPTGATDTCAY